MLNQRCLQPIIRITLLCALLLTISPGQVASALSDVPVWEATGEQEGGQYGYAVASAGDVNGDGFADVLVGAPHVGDDVYRAGVIFASYGSQNGLSIEPSWTAASTMTGANFGHAVSGAGDVNADGYDDVIVGAYRYNSGNPEEGAAFLYYGSQSGLVITPTWTIEGQQSEAQLGYSVASAGDVNGDGYGDVIVGARYYTNENTREGAAFVFYGSEEGLSAEPDWMAYGGQAVSAFGYAVGGGGDVNGDGYDDVVVGAPLYDTLEENEGAVYLYYGSPSGLEATPAWIREGDQTGAYLGVSVAIVADMNQDGRDEVAAGASQYSGRTQEDGAAFLFFGRTSTPRSLASWMGLGGQEYSGFGISVSGAGDVNADGYGDLLVGADRYTHDQPDEGAMFLYYGGPLGVNTYPAWKAYGNKAETSFGFSVAAAGDINGDECDDVIAGAPDYRINTIIVGGAFQYNGSPEPVRLMYLPLVR